MSNPTAPTLPSQLFQATAQARKELAALVRVPAVPPKILYGADAVISHSEVNQRHGTGVLIRRLFPNDRHIISIRSADHYDGEHSFGAISLLLNHDGLTRERAARNAIDFLGCSTIKRICCVPYYPDDLITSLAISRHFEAPLCTYLMDDNNLTTKVIPDALMAEFLDACSLRLTTHPEMRDAYEKKYQRRFYLLPALAPDGLICSGNDLSVGSGGVLLGSIWSRHWFNMLRSTISGAGISVDWYGNAASQMVTGTREELAADGIQVRSLLPEEELVPQLRRCAYVLVPTGTLDEQDDRQDISSLSLPGRILFVLATSNTPVIVLGSQQTPAARFVRRFGVGLVSAYNPQELKAAIEVIQSPQQQQVLRQQAARLAPILSARGISRWLWSSLEAGEPVDRRFEEFFTGNE